MILFCEMGRWSPAISPHLWMSVPLTQWQHLCMGAQPCPGPVSSKLLCVNSFMGTQLDKGLGMECIHRHLQWHSLKAVGCRCSQYFLDAGDGWQAAEH